MRDAEPEVSRGGTSSAVTAAAICRTRSARIHAAAAQKQDGSSSAAAFCLCRPVPMLSYHIQQKAQQQISVSVQHLLGSRISARTTGNGSFAEGPALPRASPRQRPPLPTAKKDPRQRAFTDGSALGKARPSEKASFAEMLALGKDRLSAKEPRQERHPLSSPLPRVTPFGSRQRGCLCRAPCQALGKEERFFLVLDPNFFCNPCILYTSTCSNLGAFYNILLYFIN